MEFINRLKSLISFLFAPEPSIVVNNSVIKFYKNGDVTFDVSNNFFINYNFGVMGTDINQAQQLVNNSAQVFNELDDDRTSTPQTFNKSEGKKGCAGCKGCRESL